MIRCLSNDIAIADGKWELRGVLDSAGKLLPMMEGQVTLVVRRTGAMADRGLSLHNQAGASRADDTGNVAEATGRRSAVIVATARLEQCLEVRLVPDPRKDRIRLQLARQEPLRNGLQSRADGRSLTYVDPSLCPATMKSGVAVTKHSTAELAENAEQ